MAGRVWLMEPGDEQADHAACVVARVAGGAGAQVADGVQEPEGIGSGADLAGGGRGVEQLSAHGHEAVEEVGVQGLEAGLIGLERRGEPVLGDQEAGEQVDPAGQRGVRCAAAGEQGWPGSGAGVDLAAVEGPDVAMSHTTAPRFGIATAPQQVTYPDVLRVWREADTIPQIEHAWVFDHLLPIAGDLDGPIFEGWTLSALAAQTERLRLGVLVTSNRFRPPAMLAKIAATVDVISGGRLDFGIGAGSRPSLPTARREYEAHGLPYHDFAHSVGDLAEACTVIRRLWTSEQPFDFDGSYLHLTGAFCNPKPVQQPYPPILIGGRSAQTLRVAAEHADLWNMPGGDIDDAVRRSAMLDRFCTETGRDPASITRSIILPASYHHPGNTRKAIAEATDAGFPHIILGLPAPYPEKAAQWVADELINEPA